MNFEFLKGLRGLGKIYKNCANAEMLAVSMPAESMVTARKSAESLAKFIYIAAHSEEIGSLTFVDILGDPVFREFINNRDVLKAFHFIRKSGNRAVHSDEDETVEDAMAVLEDLHYVAGESACILGLINDYPAFKDKIGQFTDIKSIEVIDAEKTAHEMFLEYVEKYNAQIERDKYYQNNIDNLSRDLDNLTSDFLITPGYVDLNDSLEFKVKPRQPSSLKPIQAYYGFLGIRALKKLRGELYGELEDKDLEFTGALTIYGNNGYTTSGLYEFVYGVLHDLPSAEGFKISTKYYGPSVAPRFEANERERKEEFITEIATIGKTEDLKYSFFEFLYDHGASHIGTFENGKWIDLDKLYSSEIIDKDFGQDWWCWDLDLSVGFDHEKYPGILYELQNCVRKHVPKDQLEYCEGAWEDGEVSSLCSSISWYPRQLRVVQDFLDEINSIIQPINTECKCEASGRWYINVYPFAVAEWKWTDNGFMISGTQF